MKLATALLLLLAGCASRDQWPPPFAFVGIPERVEEKTYQTIDGTERRQVIKIIKVTKGAYDEREIGFGFGENDPPPLKLGQPYLFEAFYTRHGIHYAKWTETKMEPNPPTAAGAVGTSPAASAGHESERIDRDHTQIAVEAVVLSYGEEHIVAHGEGFAVVIDQKVPASYLEIRSPDGPFDRRLTIYSESPLPEGHPLRQAGAVVQFAAEKRFLVALLSDPSKPHDTAFLYVDHVLGLKKK